MSEKSSKMMESPIPVPPEAGLEVGRPRPISHQDGLQVDWEAQTKYEAALIQREIVAELEGNRQFLRSYRRILGVSVMWFWVLVVVIVALLAAGIGGGIASGMKDKNKNNHPKHNHTESLNITSPCQIDSGANNNSILLVTSHQDTVPTNFRLFCNRTFDVASSVRLMQFAIPDSIANMNGCMEACLDHNAGGSNSSKDDANDSCYAVTINTNETTGQQWCKLFSATEWGTDAFGADCAVNLSPLSLPDTTSLQTRVKNITLTSTTSAKCTPASSGACLEDLITKGIVTTATVSLQSLVLVSELVMRGQILTASEPTSTTY
ncbi:uncharacterized protein EAE98_010508 [Botrytis deweyae]|uniref:Apple domain-containing protein n=1 Tax=Botrytis deweyae TaxID=2478750 RepID=A0ABQ7I928_9HELO|nr:uncharacterized protein EAE98_010508 [Botrytis deweyae]KAF7916786.1 hypothetical protein EAE98_010508 [Botrytis deweyae]